MVVIGVSHCVVMGESLCGNGVSHSWGEWGESLCGNGLATEGSESLCGNGVSNGVSHCVVMG